MHKVRTLTINNCEYDVSNERGIVSPGKFEGEPEDEHYCKDCENEL